MLSSDYIAGLRDGMKIGTQIGFKAGVEVGLIAGFEVGKQVGFQAGIDYGLNVGANIGAKLGKNIGFLEGYDRGYKDSSLNQPYIPIQRLLESSSIELKIDVKKYPKISTCSPFVGYVKSYRELNSMCSSSEIDQYGNTRFDYFPHNPYGSHRPFDSVFGKSF